MKILGYNYKVVISDEILDCDLIGQKVGGKELIRLARGMTYQRKSSVMLHEIVHVISDMLKLDLTEQAVSGLEAGLFSALDGAGVDLSPIFAEASER